MKKSDYFLQKKYLGLIFADLLVQEMEAVSGMANFLIIDNQRQAVLSNLGFYHNTLESCIPRILWYLHSI